MLCLVLALWRPRGWPQGVRISRRTAWCPGMVPGLVLAACPALMLALASSTRRVPPDRFAPVCSSPRCLTAPKTGTSGKQRPPVILGTFFLDGHLSAAALWVLPLVKRARAAAKHEANKPNA